MQFYAAMARDILSIVYFNLTKLLHEDDLAAMSENFGQKQIFLPHAATKREEDLINV